MIHEVGIKIKLTRIRDDFCLMGAMVGKVQIVQASVFVSKVKLMPSVFLAHAKTLERSPAKYPIRRVVCKSFAIPQNYLDVSHEKRPLRSPSSAAALARGAAVCGAEVFDDFIGLAFQRGIGATRGRALQTATPRNVGRRLSFFMAS